MSATTADGVDNVYEAQELVDLPDQNEQRGDWADFGGR
jgi:hypothetical protein